MFFIRSPSSFAEVKCVYQGVVSISSVICFKGPVGSIPPSLPSPFSIDLSV